MNLPNKLTVSRVIMIPFFLIFLLSGWIAQPFDRYLALVIFIAASITDTLDGHIARSRNLITNFGKFMDPLADKLLVSAAMISMVELKELPAWIVVIIISREFIITGFRLLAVESGLVIAASWWGKIKTVTQMLMIIYLLLGFHGFIFDTIKALLVTLAVVFTIISGVDYIVKNKDVLKG